MSGASPVTETQGALARDADAALPRLLVGVPEDGALNLDAHFALHGPLPAIEGRPRRRRGREEPALIGRLERAGLRGRGGAGFPTASKLRAVASSSQRPVLVINAAEGEPASRKDSTLCQMLPHLVLDGGELAARAIAAEELIVCISAAAPTSVRRMGAAIAERKRRGAGQAPTRVVAVPEHYVAGEESALVNHLNGARAIPTFTPPMPFEQGVRRRPTLISNAETLAHIALIARHGSRWFRQLGTPAQPGSTLVTLSGPVLYPGVYEIEPGASLSALIDAAGGANARIRGALFGGYSGTWIGGELVPGLALSSEQLAPHGASLGPGVVLLLSEHACPAAEIARVARWLARQSTSQCGPCVNGLDALASAVEEIAAGARGVEAAQRATRLASLVRGRGACKHPDGAVDFILSALDAFTEEFADHARNGPCERCEQQPEMPLPAPPRRARLASSSESIL